MGIPMYDADNVEDVPNLVANCLNAAEAAILKAVRENHRDLFLKDIFTIGPVPFLDISDSMKTAYTKIYTAKHLILPVMEGEVMVGVLDSTMVNRILTMKEKLSS